MSTKKTDGEVLNELLLLMVNAPPNVSIRFKLVRLKRVFDIFYEKHVLIEDLMKELEEIKKEIDEKT